VQAARTHSRIAGYYPARNTEHTENHGGTRNIGVRPSDPVFSVNPVDSVLEVGVLFVLFVGFVVKVYPGIPIFLRK